MLPRSLSLEEPKDSIKKREYTRKEVTDIGKLGGQHQGDEKGVARKVAKVISGQLAAGLQSKELRWLWLREGSVSQKRVFRRAVEFCKKA